MPKCMHEKNLPYSVTHLEKMDIDEAGNTEVRGGLSSRIKCDFGENDLFIHLFICYFLSTYYVKDPNFPLEIYYY